MDQQLLETIVNSLTEIAKEKAFITIDDLMDVLDEFNVPITKTDHIAAIINGMGLRIFDHIPSEEELLALSQETDDTKDPDYAQIDYESLFREILEMDPGLEGLISYIREVRPAQHGEANYIFRHMSEDGKKRIFDMSLRAVVRIAYGVAKSEGYELADLIQEGACGLLAAIDKYDVNDESVFGSYANFWIFQYISRCTSFRRNDCYYPVHMSDTIKKVIDTLLKYGYLEEEDEFEDYEDLIARLASDCSLDPEQVGRILVYLKYPVSIDELKEYEDDGDTTFTDNGHFEEAMIEDVARKIQRESIENALSDRLKERQQEIIKLRYGFYDGRCYTLEECGAKFGLTRERIRQIEGKSLRNLNHYFKTVKKSKA